MTSEGLSEGEVPTTLESSKQTYDYSEPVESASSLSTPKGDENPFEQDDLGDTVIHFGDVSVICVECLAGLDVVRAYCKVCRYVLYASVHVYVQ